MIVRTESALMLLRKSVSKATRIAFDVETTSVDPMTCELVGFSVGWEIETQVVTAYVPITHKEPVTCTSSDPAWIPQPAHRPDMWKWESISGQVTQQAALEFLQWLVLECDAPLYMHNAKYEWIVLKQLGLEIPTTRIYDTMILASVYDTNRYHGLKDLLRDWLDKEMEDISTLLAYKIGNRNCTRTFDQVDLAQAEVYTHKDVVYLFELWQYCWEKMDQATKDVYTFLEQPLISVCARMQWTGVPVDWQALIAYRDKLSQAMEDAVRVVKEIGVQYTGMDIWINSGPQLSWLYAKMDVDLGKMGIPLVGREGGKFYSMAAEYLTTVADNTMGDAQAVAKAVIEYKQRSKILSTYVDSYLGYHRNHKTERVHGTFDQRGTITGRLSSYSPNMQNIPGMEVGGTYFRSVISAPAGFTLVSIDYSQIEPRVLASVCLDPSMRRAFLGGQDIYKATAAALFGVAIQAVTKEQRSIGKVCVPLDSEILTEEGWLSWDRIKPGMKTIGMGQDGRMCWTPILGVQQPFKSDTVRLHTKDFAVECTPNHRWLSDRRVIENGNRVYRRSFVEAQYLNTEDNLVLSAPMQESPKMLPISDAEAALIGWAYSEGWVDRSEFVGASSQAGGSRIRFEVRFCQSKPVGIAAIEQVIAALPVSVSEFEADHPGMKRYRLQPAYARDLWQRAGLYEQEDHVGFVLNMTISQRKAWLDAVRVAEGHFKRGTTWIITQNEGPFQEAIEVAVYMEGYFPRVSRRLAWTGKMRTDTRQGKPRVTGQRLQTTDAGVQDVWCVRTEVGTWTMRQKGQVMLTGNCTLAAIYGSGPGTMVWQSGCSWSEAEKHLKKFFRIYPGIGKYHQGLMKGVRQTGYVSTLFGRRRYLDKDNPPYTVVVNTPIQGTAADLLKQTMVETDVFCGRHGIQMIMSIHDEMVFLVPDEKIALVQKLVELMESAGKDRLNVPLLVEAKSGKNWQDMQPMTIRHSDPDLYMEIM